jgi:cell division inhibitor SulA/protein ImuA
MPPSLDLVLQNPAIWRGDQYAKVAVESIPSGFDELDAQLPGGGWPRAALTELLAGQPGIGELRLLAPALAHLSREEKWLVLIAPPYRPYAPGFESLGVELARLVVVSTRSQAETFWAAERCLRSGACAAVLAWPGPGSERVLRRLQLAAEQGKSFGVLFGPTRNAAAPSPAPLRIQLSAARGRLGLQILKRRGGGWAPPLSLALDARRFARPLTPGPSPAAGRGWPALSREGRGSVARDLRVSRLQRLRHGVA